VVPSLRGPPESRLNCQRRWASKTRHHPTPLEITKARKAERDGPRRKLFPIALVPYREIQKWQCLDPYTGEDLAGEIRQYFLPEDFSNWKDHDSFERAFAALLRDLRAQAQP